uniref:Pappalysin-1 n=1 Tax=Panagrellus redivivus TaxID=6233 RepID=A0A7E4UM93_PANRE
MNWVVICYFLIQCIVIARCSDSTAFPVYLNGSTALRLDNEIMVVEGGQLPGVSLLELTDLCSAKSVFRLALDGDGEQDLRLTVKMLQGDVDVVSGAKFKFGVVTKLEARLANQAIEVWIDGARVARRRMFIGTDGSREKLIGLRGGVRDLEFLDARSKKPLLKDPLISLSNWHVIGSTDAIWESFQRPAIGKHPKPSLVKIPSCGKTACDNPETVIAYSTEPRFRHLKTLKYTVLVPANDDGSDPEIEMHQIQKQHDALLDAYRRYNISFEMNVQQINKSSIRSKTLIFGCSPTSVGDGSCQNECKIEATGFDGGDCLNDQQCDESILGDGKCDSDCNTAKFDYDRGDCCQLSTSEECIDPTSPLRRYMSPEEYKEAHFPLPESAQNTLPVYLAHWPAELLVGISTFPWEPEYLSPYGGILYQSRYFGVTGHLTHFAHEMGHILGLWHVHHGVVEVTCEDPCYESEASLLTGDLVADTPPTTKSDSCSPPKTQFLCGRYRSFVDAPVSNFMGYSDEECTDRFTPQQVARMHCYLDLKYGSWMPVEMKAVHVPIAPKIVPKSKSSVEIIWSGPLNEHACGPFVATDPYSYCTPDRRLVQYGYKANSTKVYNLHNFWKPEQATGPPDSVTCSPSVHGWLPDTPSCNGEDAEHCVLRVWPEIETIVERISIWFSWNAANGVRRVKLVFGDDSERVIDDVFAQCDQPFVFNVYEKTRLREVQIQINNPFVGVDAIEMTSRVGDGQCSDCMPFMYRVIRKSAVEETIIGETFGNSLVDDTLGSAASEVEYFVVVVDGDGKESLASPSAAYTVASKETPHCGDGILTSPEACDDGNLFDGDGCSAHCTIEHAYTCDNNTETSQCYIYKDDDICDPFEDQTSKDCVSITAPSSFIDVIPVHFRAFVAPPNGPTKAEDVKMCEFKKKLKHVIDVKEGQCPVIVDPMDQCGRDFRRSMETGAITLKAEYPAVLPTHVVFDFGKIYFFGDTNPIPRAPRLQFKLVAVMENEKIVEFDDFDVGSEVPSLAINLIPFLSKVADVQKVKAIVLKNVKSEPRGLAITGLSLRIDKAMDVWTVAECHAHNTLYDPNQGICLPRSMIPATCHTEPKVTFPVTSNCKGKSVCQLACVPGFAATPLLPTLHCSNGIWPDTALLRPPTDFCKQTDCVVPKIPFANVTCPYGTGYHKKCYFKCDPTAVMIGEHKNQVAEVMCNGDETWTEQKAFCLPVCKVSDIHERNITTDTISCRSELTIRNRGKPSQLKRSIWPVRSTCRAICKKDHKVWNSPSPTKMKVVCGAHGQWIGPSCTLAQCPHPKTIYAGLYNCTNGFNVGSECRYKCPGLTQPKISRCLTNGVWSLKHPCTVTPKLSCPTPMSTKHINYTCSNKMFAGQHCSAACTSRGYDLVQEERLVLPGSQVGLNFLPVSKLACTASSQLFPPPNELKCVRSCNKDIMGDGWCDFQNNRGYCKWDGGDCCPSTVRNGKVRFMFPTLCTNALCRCIDPNAEENAFNGTAGDRRRIKRLLEDDTPAKKHWIENLFKWLDVVITDNASDLNTTGLAYLADELAILQTNETTNLKYLQISSLNFEMRTVQSRKTVEATRKMMVERAIAAANLLLSYKSGFTFETLNDDN